LRPPITENQKIRYAEEALLSYQNEMIGEFDDDYTMSYSNLLSYLTNRDYNFLSFLGNAVYIADFGQRRLNEAMARVVEKSTPEKIPTTSVFIKGITDELTSFDFSIFGDVAIDIAVGAANRTNEISNNLLDGVTGVSKGIKDVGESSGTILKSLPFIIGAILLGIVLIKGKIISKVL